MAKSETGKTDGVGLPAGTRIGKYEVKERLAIGGQAIVYKCHDSILDRPVAIKQISSHLAEDPKFMDRFRKEAQILARLCAEQPVIVTVHDVVEDEKGLFLVMEYVEGPTLEMVIRDSEGPTDQKAVLQILWRLAAALYDVHAAGIIHRDLKPSNIIIAEGLRPKIMDFGVAASSSGQTSMVLGTTKYMAPELFEGGKDVDARADQYSLGFMMYELLLGRPKFNEVFSDIVRDRHSEALRWMKWHGNEKVVAPPLHELNPSVPKPLSDIVARMIEKDPDDRFENMEVLGRTIKQSFSRKAKGGAAGPDEAEVAVRGRRAGRRPGGRRAGAAGAAAGAGDYADQHDEDYIPPADSTPTAELPKKKGGLKLLIAMAVSVFLVLLIGGVYMVIQNSQEQEAIQQAARNAYREAVKPLQKGLRNVEQGSPSADTFETASDKLEAVARKWPSTAVGAKASVWAPLAKAYQLTLEAHNATSLSEAENLFTESARADEKAQNAIDRVESNWPTLSQWLDERPRDYLRISEDFRRQSKFFVIALLDARGAMQSNSFDDAMGFIQREIIDRDLNLRPWQEKQKDELVVRINRERLQKQVDTLIAQATSQLAEEEFQQAVTKFQRAKTLLEGEEAAKLLGSDTVSQRLASIEQQLQTIGQQRALLQARAAVTNAVEAGELAQELEARRKLEEIDPSDSNVTRMTELKALLALARAKALIQADRIAEAKRTLQRSLSFVEMPEAKSLLTELEQSAEYDEVFAAANAAFRAGKYQEALQDYIQAMRLKPENAPQIQPKVQACNFRIKHAEAEQLAREGKFAEAIRAYENAKEIDKTKANIIDSKVSQLRTKKKYEEYMAAGDKALQNDQFADARANYKKAQEVVQGADVPEIKEKISKSWFMEYLARGKSDMERRDYVSARANFNLASNYGSSQELTELMKKVRELIAASTEEEE
ncbi:MAG: protein kinase domain-containing protein [Phycisphaerae bacterium]